MVARACSPVNTPARPRPPFILPSFPCLFALSLAARSPALKIERGFEVDIRSRPASLGSLDAGSLTRRRRQITVGQRKVNFPSLLGPPIFSACLAEESPGRWCLHLDTMRKCAMFAVVNLILMVAFSCSAQVSQGLGKCFVLAYLLYVQGDTSHSSLGSIDIKSKVAFILRSIF